MTQKFQHFACKDRHRTVAFLAMDEVKHLSVPKMVGIVAIVVATVILVFFGIGYLLGRLFV
jgi:hypothetical protein